MSYIAGVLFLLLLVVGGAGSWYYNDTQERMATLRENNAKLEVAIETSEQSIDLLQQDMAKQAELNQQLTSNLQKAEAYGDELRATLRKHDLTGLARKKPGLIEKKMNNATEKLWSDITNDTTSERVQPPSVEQPTGTGSKSSNEG